MPLVAAGVITGGSALISTIYGSKKQASTQKQALAAETSYTNQALAAQQEQNTYDRQQTEIDRQNQQIQLQRQAEQDRLLAQQIQRDQEQREWDRRRLEQQMANDLASQRWNQAFQVDNTNQARRSYGDFVQTLEPYRAAGTSANSVLASLVGIKVPKYTGGTYYDLARNASVPVNVPENG